VFSPRLITRLIVAIVIAAAVGSGAVAIQPTFEDVGCVTVATETVSQGQAMVTSRRRDGASHFVACTAGRIRVEYTVGPTDLAIRLPIQGRLRL